MIQRIQSLYLFIGAALLSACLFMPLWTTGITGEMAANLNMDAFSITTTYDNASVAGVAYIGVSLIITILLSLFIIMQFKKRALQIRLCLLNVFLIFATIGLMYLGTTTGNGLISKYAKLLAGVQPQVTIAFFFPAIAAMLNLLAMRSIKKDEELVRSADRIR